MIHIETVDLSARGIVLPTDRVGMVIGQPYLSLSANEPYRCTLEARPRQLQMLSDTLRVARDALHGLQKTHFTVFPEYSIPGVEGIAAVQNALAEANWPNGTIVIGGVDALSKDQFAALAAEPNTHFDAAHNGLARIAPTDWINCGITWVKAADGQIERWLQPKIFPAWPEQNVSYQDMFHGRSIFAFSGLFDNYTHYRFCSLVCFDWIANVAGQRVWRWVLNHFQEQAIAVNGELSLSWVFVIQHNPKPSHDSFLTEVVEFFDQTVVPTVRRERACLVFANSAGKTVPGRTTHYGASSLIFSGQALFTKPKCHSTFSNGGQRFRSSTLLEPHFDVLFRESGACIHSFSQVNPGSLAAGAAGKTIAVQDPYVFPLAEQVDPRTPSAPVPASVKWLNDELDTLASLGKWYPEVPLASAANAIHDQTVTALRVIPAQSVTHAVNMATDSPSREPDAWEKPEVEAVENLVHTLDIVSLGFGPANLAADPAHATVAMNGKAVDLLAIRGPSHESCLKHSKNFLPLPRRQMLLVSRDRDNNPWRKEFGSFLSTQAAQLGGEPDITDPASGLLHLGYRRLLDIFQQSATPDQVRGAISAELA